MVRAKLTIGEGKTHSGSGTGAWDHHIQLRVVRGTYMIEREGCELEARRTIHFDWAPLTSKESPLNTVFQEFLEVAILDEIIVDEFGSIYQRYWKGEITAADFRTYVDKLVMQYITPEIFLQVLEACYDLGQQKGVSDLRREIKSILDI